MNYQIADEQMTKNNYGQKTAILNNENSCKLWLKSELLLLLNI